jgi:hypothetical protein
MAKDPRALKRPRDPVQLGKLIGDILTGQVEDKAPPKGEMEELGRLGGLKGGAARAAALSPERRKEIAKAAAAKRWAKKR